MARMTHSQKLVHLAQAPRTLGWGELRLASAMAHDKSCHSKGA
jgi:hypothetical protein